MDVGSLATRSKAKAAAPTRYEKYLIGSAGTYNLDQPDIAFSLGAQKAKAIAATGADIVATGNIGCLTQLRAHMEKVNSPIRVRHTLQVLRDAYRDDQTGPSGQRSSRIRA